MQKIILNKVDSPNVFILQVFIRIYRLITSWFKTLMRRSILIVSKHFTEF